MLNFETKINTPQCPTIVRNNKERSSFAALYNDGQIRLYNDFMFSNSSLFIEQTAYFKEQETKVMDFQFDPVRPIIAANALNHKIYFFDLNQPRFLKRSFFSLFCALPIDHFVYDQLGSKLFFKDRGSLRALDLDKNKVLSNKGHTNLIISALENSNRFIFAGCADGYIRVYSEKDFVLVASVYLGKGKTEFFCLDSLVYITNQSSLLFVFDLKSLQLSEIVDFGRNQKLCSPGGFVHFGPLVLSKQNLFKWDTKTGQKEVVGRCQQFACLDNSVLVSYSKKSRSLEFACVS